MEDRTTNAVERPLAMLNGARPEAPDWYRALQLEPAETLLVPAEGASVEALVWGEPDKPGIVLAHGGWAHARWWGPVAPLLARDFRVVGLSYSGMGGSEWRSAYSFDLQVAELFAAARAAGLFNGPRPPIFIGHSFGSRSVAQAAATRGNELAGAILVDSAIMPKTLQAPDREASDARFATLESALSRFRLKPPQPCTNLFILDDIARASLAETPDGWRWRFDPAFLQKFAFGDAWPSIAQPKCPLALVHAENSVMVTPEVLAAQRQQVPRGTPFIGVPNSGHHIMIDQPIALATALSALAQTWLQR